MSLFYPCMAGDALGDIIWIIDRWTAPFKKIWDWTIFWIIVHIDNARLLLATSIHLIPILSRVYFLKEDTCCCCCLPSYICVTFYIWGKKEQCGGMWPFLKCNCSSPRFANTIEKWFLLFVVYSIIILVYEYIWCSM